MVEKTDCEKLEGVFDSFGVHYSVETVEFTDSSLGKIKTEVVLEGVPSQLRFVFDPEGKYSNTKYEEGEKIIILTPNENANDCRERWLMKN